MIEIEAKTLLSAATQLRATIILATQMVDKTAAIGLDDRQYVLNSLTSLISELEKLGARSAFRAADRLRDRLANDHGGISYTDLSVAMTDIESRLADHLDDIQLFVLQPNETALMQPVDNLLSVTDHPIEGFSQAYPNASFELEESAKCLALARSSAAVFHCMRALECGIKAFSRLLGTPDPIKAAEKNWGIILQSIEGELDSKFPRSGRLPNTEGAQLERLFATLTAVKNPWRNATMHVETIYAPHEALHILRCTSMFMLELSSFCDEAGRQPSDAPAMAESVAVIEGSS